MFIAFAGQKGGAGKSILSLHVAAYLARNAKTALIDADALRTVTHWSARGGDALGVPIFGDKQAVRIAAQFEHIVFDCAGRADRDELRDLSQACDRLLCPVPVDALNLDAALSLGEVFAALEITNYHCLLNRAPHTIAPRAVNEARELLADAGLPVLTTVIHESAAFRHAAALGTTVERVPASLCATGAQAWREIESLTKELLNL